MHTEQKRIQSSLVREVLSWQLGCALATLGKRVGGGRREILTCRNFMHHAVQPPLNWSAIGRQWRQRSRQYGSQLPRPSPRYTALNFVKGTLYLVCLWWMNSESRCGASAGASHAEEDERTKDYVRTTRGGFIVRGGTDSRKERAVLRKMIRRFFLSYHSPGKVKAGVMLSWEN